MASIDISTFPDRPECFGLFNLTNTTCTMPTSTMVDFLNITDYSIYKKMYCVNPPQDSCAFGYCPNPDIGSPAVRFSTYIQTLCFSILIYYSPDEIVGALYAQMLSSYSLMLSAITAAVAKQLTVFHALIVLNALGSPLALFLTIYALRGIFGKAKRMEVIFGRGKVLNRTLMLIMLPIWMAGLITISIPRSAGWFQQGACNKKDFGASTIITFLAVYIAGPFLLLSGQKFDPRMILLAFWFTILVAGIVSIYFRRKSIWKKGSRWFPLLRIWRNIGERYPFVHFSLAVIFPMSWWIFAIELDAAYIHEYFTPTQGQILAIFAALPATLQAVFLVPRMLRWFMGLSWVLFVTRRPQKSLNTPGHIATSQYDSTAAFEHPLAMPSPCLETLSLHKMPSPVILQVQVESSNDRSNDING
ncbi:hypothetical protein BD410DRAFT_793660 [Rickenella mellea]|uniref:Uncharacterized protein n=1 Tax=Rickenella mellea TaxID=50990 RepID=A0A4Y7PS39_9AGAM|nr:hypothetical protein BD410DRAFT_793660 [Rickenella mellea]